MAKKLYKSSSDKMLMGVCGGLAEYLGMDSTVFRILYAIVTMFTGGFPGIVLYFVMGLVMPEN
ncbi:MAG: PspC domain-containing protein [Spirochaetales bacterium]|nr:PspC domain-containing protein [Spirochaetales bacterium]